MIDQNIPGEKQIYGRVDGGGTLAADAGAALEADDGTTTFLPVSVSAGGIDSRVSLSFFGGGCGGVPEQPASSANGDSTQCAFIPNGSFTVFCTVVFSITLSTARPTVLAPSDSWSGAQSWLKRVGLYGNGDLPLDICEPLIPGAR